MAEGESVDGYQGRGKAKASEAATSRRRSKKMGDEGVGTGGWWRSWRGWCLGCVVDGLSRERSREEGGARSGRRGTYSRRRGREDAGGKSTDEGAAGVATAAAKPRCGKTTVRTPVREPLARLGARRGGPTRW